VQYRWPDAPLVSIIIQTRDREEYLRPLLDSIATRTRYPNYEIIVVDNDSTDPDTLAFLARLAARPLGRPRRVVACPASSAGRPAPTPAPPRPRATTCCSSTTTPTSCRTTGWTA
jgi:cellulose synthase/poly-beta-1,6-N-acetylglucosamine synthase-like glycosyltransferase